MRECCRARRVSSQARAQRESLYHLIAMELAKCLTDLAMPLLQILLFHIFSLTQFLGMDVFELLFSAEETRSYVQLSSFLPSLCLQQHR